MWGAQLNRHANLIPENFAPRDVRRFSEVCVVPHVSEFFSPVGTARGGRSDPGFQGRVPGPDPSSGFRARIPGLDSRSGFQAWVSVPGSSPRIWAGWARGPTLSRV